MSNVVALRDTGPVSAESPGVGVWELPADVRRMLDAEADQAAVIPDTKWAESLRALVDHQQALFRRMGHDEQAARRLAQASVLALAEYGGGRQWYLPKGDVLRRALRDLEIYRCAHRGNIEALAKAHRLTVQQVYRIVHAQRRVHVARRQGQLFESAPSGSGAP